MVTFRRHSLARRFPWSVLLWGARGGEAGESTGPPVGTESSWCRGGFALVGLLALADVVVTPEAKLGATFAIAPFLAASGATPRQTAAVATVATAVSLAFAFDGRTTPAAAAIRAAVVMLTSLLAVVAADRRVARERRLSAIGWVADVVQQAILVPVPSRLGRFVFASTYASATEEARPGGDFFDVVETPRGPG